MCGIGAYFSENDITQSVLKELNDFFEKIQHRGPDETVSWKPNRKSYFKFHRLRVNGVNLESGQPMTNTPYIMICNGEIYNYKKLAEQYDIPLKTGSDCEIILPLMEKIGVKQMLQSLDGVFGMVIYNMETHHYIVARDPIGIRSLYYGKRESEFIVVSEMKAIPEHWTTEVDQFPSGCYYDSKYHEFTRFYEFKYDTMKYEHWTEEQICEHLKTLIIKAINKRRMTNRVIASIVSGGIDSTRVTSALKLLTPDNVDLHTFTIGIEGAVDLHYARKAAKAAQA